MIDAWLDDQMLGISRRYVEPPRAPSADRLLLGLASCFAPSHVIPELGARTKTTVVEELAAHAHSLGRSEEHTSELQSRLHLVCRLLLEKKKHAYTRSREQYRSLGIIWTGFGDRKNGVIFITKLIPSG